MALIVSTCMGCGQQDDHPKHVEAFGSWHTDCHAWSSFACPICQAVVDSHDGLKGSELRTHLEQNDPARAVVEQQNARAVVALDENAEA